MPGSDQPRPRKHDPSRVIPIADAINGKHSNRSASDETISRRAPSNPSELLASLGCRRRLPKGCSLSRASDNGAHLYFIEGGQIELFLRNDSGHFPIASFHSGACFFCNFDTFRRVQGIAAEPSMVCELPLHALDRLGREGIELGPLMRRYRPFDLQAFVTACYPR